MASGTLGDSYDELIAGARSRSTENIKVYTRRPRKNPKTCNNNDTATTTASIAENLSSVVPTTPTNPDPKRTDAAADVSAASPNNCAAVSPPPTTPGSPATTTTPHRTEGGQVVQDSRDAVVTKDVDSHQQQSHSRGSTDNDGDSSLQSQHAEENSDNREQEGSGSGSQTAEVQNLEDSPSPNINETQNLEKLPPLQSAIEPLQTSGVTPQNMRESSPLSHEKDIPNSRGVAGAQMPIGNEAEDNASVMPGSPQVPQGNGPVNVNGVVKPLVISSIDDRIRFNLCKATPKNEIKELKKKLQGELGQVSWLVKQLETKELQIASYNTQISNSNISNSGNYIIADGGYSHPQPQQARSDVVDRRLLVRVNSEVGPIGHQETRHVGLARMNSDMGAARNLETRPYSRQLSVAVMENNYGASEFVEKEKRTPKANQFYRNSEFLLGKDRLPPESNKRLKTNNGRKHSGESEHGFGFGFHKSKNQVFKNCSSLLQKLMKHKHGWVFNEPVNAKDLGLVDYHDIIKHPMDLGTIKTRMSQNWYKTPRDFAEDVRLVFRNAMTYNPKGQDVHIMAEQLLEMMEDSPPQLLEGVAQSHFGPASVLASAPAAAAPISLYAPPGPQMRTFDRPEPMTASMAIDPKIHRPHVGRTPVPKKPKAKDPDKRDMTYEEKQRLSTNLQGLPNEKLDAIVQIIKKRNTALSQHDDEIEVDIDRVDTETLWELDRFVTNYKKGLSKNKRKAELALQRRTLANQNVALTNSVPAVAQVQIQSGAAFEKSTDPPAEGEKRGYNGSRSSSSSSSSSDSGSSSSDSDSDSSSGDGSDAGHSPSWKDVILEKLCHSVSNWRICLLFHSLGLVSDGPTHFDEYLDNASLQMMVS
ncbi:hypothetical protein DH2020_033800 [Rehmannia glutinosa]|uniref:Transcription factor GTE4-like n=1 Tax=Rehmannia glutinosa TaxID=99300 RepID=A0ABR0VBC6_REHGL